MTLCPSYRKQSINLLCKPMDWFLYDRDLRHERVKHFLNTFLVVGRVFHHWLYLYNHGISFAKAFNYYHKKNNSFKNDWRRCWIRPCISCISCQENTFKISKFVLACVSFIIYYMIVWGYCFFVMWQNKINKATNSVCFLFPC